MKLSKNQKIGIGIITFMPILCFIGYFASFILIFLENFNDISQETTTNGNFPPTTFFAGFALALIFMALMLLSGLAAMVLHIVHVAKNEKLKAQNNGQLLWILVIVLANGIGGIIYYFIEILPEPKTALNDSPAAT